MSERNIFNYNRVPFKMFNQDFEFEYIPSIYFSKILTEAISIGFAMKQSLGFASPEMIQRVEQIVTRVFTEDILNILKSVLINQNNLEFKDFPINWEEKIRTFELMNFTSLVMNHDEIHEGLKLFLQTSGDLMNKYPDMMEETNSHYQTPKSTHSGQNVSDGPESTSTTSSQTSS
jgi:hypothetical protein